MDTDAGRILRCVAMYDNIGKRMTHIPDETDSVGPYFEALENAGYVMADDARSHPATAAFFSKSLAVHGVRSLLAVSVSINGDLYGAFTCTEVGQLPIASTANAVEPMEQAQDATRRRRMTSG